MMQMQQLYQILCQITLDGSLDNYKRDEDYVYTEGFTQQHLRIHYSGIVFVLERFINDPKLVWIRERSLAFPCKWKACLCQLWYGSLQKHSLVNDVFLFGTLQ